jgi:hypothetical protein
MAANIQFDVGNIPSSSAAMLGCLLANGDEVSERKTRLKEAGGRKEIASSFPDRTKEDLFALFSHFTSKAQNLTLLPSPSQYVRCSSCSFGGCDVRVEGCGCTLHVSFFHDSYWYFCFFYVFSTVMIGCSVDQAAEPQKAEMTLDDRGLRSESTAKYHVVWGWSNHGSRVVVS